MVIVKTTVKLLAASSARIMVLDGISKLEQIRGPGRPFEPVTPHELKLSRCELRWGQDKWRIQTDTSF
jgi:hypothetical protein